MLEIKQILIDYKKTPMGIDDAKPRFIWKLESDEKGVIQTSYSVKVSDNDGTVWESGVIESGESTHIQYEGKNLEPRRRYYVIVSVTDNFGNAASGHTWFETGLMGKFKAGFITHGLGPEEEACPVFRKTFRAGRDIPQARLYITALGVYDIELNKRRVSDEYFAPGWTSYNKRLQYQTYDITGYLKEENEIRITVANGWYKGNLAFKGKRNIYGDRAAVLAEIHIGNGDIIETDESWEYSTGQVRYSEIYHGEHQDLAYESDSWQNAVRYKRKKDNLISRENQPVRIIKKLDAKELIETPKGEKVIDFGQNLTGFVEMDCDCPKGTKITLMHAEVLDGKGNFYTENLRAARNTDIFICSGRRETVHPRFTFHGFRYAKVDGLADIDLSKFRACVLHTDMEETGSFECSDDMVNKLQHNIQWGQRGNFLDVPTDCPQRDERLGWTGDAQVFSSTAAFNFNVALFFGKWLHDLSADQAGSGAVPNVIPDVLTDEGKEPGNSAAWGDAAAIVPYEMYLEYNDTRFLEEQYESMKSWVEYISRESGNGCLWTSGRHFGDWLGLDMEQFYVNNEHAVSSTGSTDKHFIANAFFAHSTELLVKSAKALDYKNDMEKYKKLHEKIIEAFRNEFVTANGRLVSETQTAMVLALRFNLVKEEHRKALGERLADNIRQHKNHMVAGFVGSSLLCPVLSENGYHELAGKLLLQKEYPSWLYPITMGATTIWERWNGIKPDGSFERPGMNSFNHYAYGAIGDWMYGHILGIRETEPGYREFLIAPGPVEGIDSSSGYHETLYGRVFVSWRKSEDKFSMDVEIPVNCSARILMPGKTSEMTIGSGEYHFEEQYT